MTIVSMTIALGVMGTFKAITSDIVVTGVDIIDMTNLGIIAMGIDPIGIGARFHGAGI
jgi:hypothetical protein